MDPFTFLSVLTVLAVILSIVLAFNVKTKQRTLLSEVESEDRAVKHILMDKSQCEGSDEENVLYLASFLVKKEMTPIIVAFDRAKVNQKDKLLDTINIYSSGNDTVDTITFLYSAMDDVWLEKIWTQNGEEIMMDENIEEIIVLNRIYSYIPKSVEKYIVKSPSVDLDFEDTEEPFLVI